MKPKITHRPSVLRVMVMLFLVSICLRVGIQIEAATAQTVSPARAEIQRPDRILGMPLDDQTLPQILEMFKERESRLIAQEAEAKVKAETLAKSAQAIAAQLQELAEAEEKLANTLATADTAAEADLTRLATVYENMKPRDAAALFTEMAPGFAAGFLGLMRPEAAAAIMTELEPANAHLISVMLAGRNATAPTRQ